MAPDQRLKSNKDILIENGFLGTFSIDYRSHVFRARGLIGNYFLLLRSKALEGVSLDELDRAYHPFDLEVIKRTRRDLFGRAGRHDHRFRVKDPFSSSFCQISCSFNLKTDGFGQPLSIQGVMFDVSEVQRPAPANPVSDLIDIAGHLKEARRLAKRNDMDCLAREIGRVFDQAGEIAVNRALE